MPKILQLNQGGSATYSPAFSVMGERRGKQRAEAVEPGSQEAQAEEESSREAGARQDADRETLKAGPRRLARDRRISPRSAGRSRSSPRSHEHRRDARTARAPARRAAVVGRSRQRNRPAQAADRSRSS